MADSEEVFCVLTTDLQLWNNTSFSGAVTVLKMSRETTRNYYRRTYFNGIRTTG